MAASGALAAPPAPVPTRPRVLLVGTAFATAAAVVGVMATIGLYLAARADVIAGGASWLPDKADIPLTPSNMAYGTMLLSGFTMAWAVTAVRRDDRPAAYLAIGLTLLFGLAVVNSTIFIYKVANIPAATETGVHFYTATGAHLVMTAAGMLFLVSQSIRTLAGERNVEGLTAASIFWYATIAVHSVIWIAIYVTK